MTRLKQMALRPRDLAAAIKVSTTAVDHWIKGKTAPNRSRQQQVADYLVISVSQLMGTMPLEPAPGDISERGRRIAALFDSMSPLRQKTAYALMMNLADEKTPMADLTKQEDSPPPAPMPKRRHRM